jgi:head-tail adaptor
MSSIAPRTNIGDRLHRVFLFSQRAPVPDGDGGYTMGTWPLDPPDWYVSIRPAGSRELERLTSGTAQTRASHVVTGPYRADVTTGTRISFNGRTLYVNGVMNPEERNIDTVALCDEHVTSPPLEGTDPGKPDAFQQNGFQ